MHTYVENGTNSITVKTKSKNNNHMAFVYFHLGKSKMKMFHVKFKAHFKQKYLFSTFLLLSKYQKRCTESQILNRNRE